MMMRSAIAQMGRGVAESLTDAIRRNALGGSWCGVGQCHQIVVHDTPIQPRHDDTHYDSSGQLGRSSVGTRNPAASPQESFSSSQPLPPSPIPTYVLRTWA